MFENVSFKYPGEDYCCLKNVTFSVKPAEKVGIVGRSGCGKSTIIKLLQGFYKPRSGKILIDGKNIEEYD